MYNVCTGTIQYQIYQEKIRSFELLKEAIGIKKHQES